MKEPIWMNLKDALAIHEKMLALYGGSAGIRDKGMLDSALSRPRNLFSYGSPSLFDLAAAYAFGIVKNHPFVDGNKRTCFVLAIAFLEINGYLFQATQADAVVQTLALAASALTESQFAHWLKNNSKILK